MHVWQLGKYPAYERATFVELYKADAYRAAREDFLVEAAAIYQPRGPFAEKEDGSMRIEGAVDLLVLERVELRTTPFTEG